MDLSNIRIVYRGGGTREDAAREPPENETAYPEPSMFGTLPAYGFYLRHARNVTLRDVEVGFEGEDLRPAFVLQDVADVHFDHVRGRLAPGRAVRLPARRARPLGARQPRPSRDPPRADRERGALTMTPSTSRALGLLVLTMTAATPLRAQVPAPAPAPAPPPAPQPARAATATDSNTPLHLLKADYPVPYGPATPEKITEVLLRVRGYLEAQTPPRIVDRAPASRSPTWPGPAPSPSPSPAPSG